MEVVRNALAGSALGILTREALAAYSASYTEPAGICAGVIVALFAWVVFTAYTGGRE